VVARRLERLKKVEVEVARRHRSRPLVGCAEEQVAPASDFVLAPFDFVFPNLVSADVGRQVGQFTALHNIAVDRQGNIYTAEVNTGQRVQKFRRLDAQN